MAAASERAIRRRRGALALACAALCAAALGSTAGGPRAGAGAGTATPGLARPGARRSDPGAGPLGPEAWSEERWRERCRGVRTSYNPSADLSDTELTIATSDPRWLDFVYWSVANKINDHLGEAYGGTGWSGPKGGVLVHFAPGSPWEKHVLLSFGTYLGHVIGEHRWMDTMFPDFFEKYGGVYGVNVKDRLAEIGPRSIAPWVDFLAYCAQPRNARYLFHRTAIVDPLMREIRLTAGQGVTFSYTYERYRYELKDILTDCEAVDFFQMYDELGPGFAAVGDWARQTEKHHVFEQAGYVGAWGPRPGHAASKPPPPPPAPAIPPDLPDAAAMKRGEGVYVRECAVCHGVGGDGKGPEAPDFDVKPRDFRQGKYEFRTTQFHELPTVGDLERVIRNGVPSTSMPAWAQFLSDREVHDVARYLIVFSLRFVDAYRSHQAPRNLEIPPPPPDLSALSDRGRKLSRLLLCFQCHGVDGRGDGESARGLVDDWGNPILPADLTHKWSFKNGHDPTDIYRTIFGGLNGTPMNSYADAVPDPTERWALVAYVLALSPPTRPVLHLKDFARERDRRIGPRGHVRPAPSGGGDSP
jgi:mono/diheme cytochrome c family protein